MSAFGGLAGTSRQDALLKSIERNYKDFVEFAHDTGTKSGRRDARGFAATLLMLLGQYTESTQKDLPVRLDTYMMRAYDYLQDGIKPKK